MYESIKCVPTLYTYLHTGYLSTRVYDRDDHNRETEELGKARSSSSSREVVCRVGLKFMTTHYDCSDEEIGGGVKFS